VTLLEKSPLWFCVVIVDATIMANVWLSFWTPVLEQAGNVRLAKCAKLADNQGMTASFFHATHVTNPITHFAYDLSYHPYLNTVGNAR